MRLKEVGFLPVTLNAQLSRLFLAESWGLMY